MCQGRLGKPGAKKPENKTSVTEVWNVFFVGQVKKLFLFSFRFTKEPEGEGRSKNDYHLLNDITIPTYLPTYLPTYDAAAKTKSLFLKFYVHVRAELSSAIITDTLKRTSATVKSCTKTWVPCFSCLQYLRTNVDT